MDTRLRELERLASCGDTRAAEALGHERLRHGLGWYGEELPPGIVALREPFRYALRGPEKLRLAMVYLPASRAWISRAPVPSFHARKLIGEGEAVGPALVRLKTAKEVCRRLGGALPSVAEWLEAALPERIQCWLLDGELSEPDEWTPARHWSDDEYREARHLNFHVVKRSA